MFHSHATPATPAARLGAMPRTPARSSQPDVVAAGAVVVRKASGAAGGRTRWQVLVVHRPRYDDWSFPKGKLDRGEHITACAVREVEEETGLRVRLGAPLSDQRYGVSNGRTKTVHYWLARVVGDDDVSEREPDDEVDTLDWLDWDEAARLLTYPHDRVTLDEARELRRRTRTLVVLRHGEALARRGWTGDDRRRPLLEEGLVQAEQLAPVLDAYGVTTVVTSSSTRCVQTVEPYASAAARPLQLLDALSEEDATATGVATVVAQLMDEARHAVLCTHRPVLPWVLQALGLPETRLEPGGMVVVHHRDGAVVATELYDAR